MSAEAAPRSSESDRAPRRAAGRKGDAPAKTAEEEASKRRGDPDRATTARTPETAPRPQESLERGVARLRHPRGVLGEREAGEDLEVPRRLLERQEPRDTEVAHGPGILPRAKVRHRRLDDRLLVLSGGAGGEKKDEQSGTAPGSARGMPSSRSRHDAADRYSKGRARPHQTRTRCPRAEVQRLARPRRRRRHTRCRGCARVARGTWPGEWPSVRICCRAIGLAQLAPPGLARRR